MDNYKDLEELGINDEDEDFQAAANHVQGLHTTLDSDALLKLYGFYKQGLEGDCTTARPSWYDFRAKSKWEAWNGLQGMPREEAKESYVRLVENIDPNYKRTAPKAVGKEGWVTVSTLQKPAESEDDDDDGERSIVDMIKSGDYQAVDNYLTLHRERAIDVNRLDGDGMSLIHWATDRGTTQIIKSLLEIGADVNVRDADGQTAIHYASSCGHLQCIELLLSQGADPHVKDNDGADAYDAANDDSVRAFLKECLAK